MFGQSVGKTDDKISLMSDTNNAGGEGLASILEQMSLMPNSDNTPRAQVAHGLDPASQSVSLCGAEWIAVTNLGEGSVPCMDCARIAHDRGLIS